MNAFFIKKQMEKIIFRFKIKLLKIVGSLNFIN